MTGDAMKTEMPKQLQRWEKVRQKGRLRFILLTGVAGWGLPMFAVMTFVVNRRPDSPPTPSFILVSAVIWALGGAVFGLSMWTISEKKYQKYLAGQKSE